ncbi:hypothetical protein N657DRAFT_283089 [Parathielavia appendiculata]|uniref:Uncharacterized protein n=1 Tax=Parathielavia appendiculata TaxID=2587402 RepID=A0AAN6U3S5_9PEZI|nr:hypothetical protein N657DRAFT_283089 [Parathielavia appendiculata]
MTTLWTPARWAQPMSDELLEACWRAKRGPYIPKQALTRRFPQNPLSALPHNAPPPRVRTHPRSPLLPLRLPARRLILPTQYKLVTRYCAGPETVAPCRANPAQLHPRAFFAALLLSCCACTPSLQTALTQYPERQLTSVRSDCRPPVLGPAPGTQYRYLPPPRPHRRRL